MKTFLFTLFTIATLCLISQNSIRVPRDAATIPAAVQLANSGDTILLSAGIYSDSAHINNKQLVIKGLADGTSILSPGVNGRSFELLNSDVEFINLTFDDFQQNTAAPNYAISATYSDVKVYKCLFNKLISPVYLSWGDLEISHSTFSDGRGASSLLMVGGTFHIHNNLFYGQNQSGVLITRANGKFFNNTVIGTPSINHYGLFINPDSISHIFNNIFEGFVKGIYLVASDSTEFNAPRIYNNNLYHVPYPYRYEYNESLSMPVFYGNLTPKPGTGEISVPSDFVDTLNRNYNLTRGSLCIDAGTNIFPNTINTDLNGNNRIVGLNPDIGAYEYSPLTSLIDQSVSLSALDLEIFPQPAKDYVFVKFNEFQHGIIELLSSSGEVIREIQTKNLSELKIQLPEADGLYFIRLKNNESVRVKKLIKI